MDASDFETAYDMLFTTIGECNSWIYKNLLQLNLYVYVYMYSTNYITTITASCLFRSIILAAHPPYPCHWPCPPRSANSSNRIRCCHLHQRRAAKKLSPSKNPCVCDPILTDQAPGFSANELRGYSSRRFEGLGSCGAVAWCHTDSIYDPRDP